MNVGQRLREARVLAGVKAKELDKLAGNAPGQQWVLEKLTEAKAVATTLGNVCTVLGLSLDYVVSGVGEPPTKESVDAAVAVARARKAAENPDGGAAPAAE